MELLARRFAELVGIRVTLLTPIRDVLGSNLGWNTGYRV
jgi:hypothetical protein